MTTKKVAETSVSDVFTRKSLMKSEVFSDRKDAIAVVVKDGEEVSIEEAQARLEKFMKGKVR